MRLIDADALMEVIRENDYPLANRTNSIDRGMFTVGIQQAVDEQPTADVVEVVRCKDCRYWKLGPMYHGCECPHGGMNLAVGTDGDEYCSYGERRNDGNL